MEESFAKPNKVMKRIPKKYIKARTQAESLGWIEPRFRTCSWLGRTIAKEGLVEIVKALPLLVQAKRAVYSDPYYCVRYILATELKMSLDSFLE